MLGINVTYTMKPGMREQFLKEVAESGAQEAVRKAIEEMTGLHVVRVDVHVQGVSFEKENKALDAGAQNAVLEAAPAETPLVEAPAEPAKEATAEEDSQA